MELTGCRNLPSLTDQRGRNRKKDTQHVRHRNTDDRDGACWPPPLPTTSEGDLTCREGNCRFNQAG